MSNIKEQIRQEIERRKKYESENYHDRKADGRPNEGWAESLAIMGELEELLSFIDSLPEEKPSEDLEEAAKEIVIKMHPCMKDCTILGDLLTRGQLMALVKAGAEWQKEQMMKDAVEGYVNYYEDSGGILMAEAQVGCPYHNGDKVKIIIVKNEE